MTLYVGLVQHSFHHYVLESFSDPTALHSKRLGGDAYAATIRWSSRVGLVLLLVAAGCAGPAPGAGPDQIRALEARVAASPGDAEGLRALGETYARAGQYDLAYDALRRAEQIAPTDPRTQIALGLVEEARGDRAEALARLEGVPPLPTYDPFVEARREWLRREVARADARALSIAEDSPQITPRQTSVAVFPLATQGGDAQTAALGRGLSQWIADDLAALGVPVVEDIRVHTLIDELGLRPTSLAPDRARYLGRLLRTTSGIIGTVSVSGGRVEVGAAPWEWEQEQVPEFSLVEGALQDVADVERRLVIALASRLGVRVTDADRERLAERASPDIDAFLLYSRGLLAEDAGRLAEAADLYREAARRDPSFGAAEAAALAVARLQAVPGEASAALAALAPSGEPSLAAQLVRSRVARLNGSLGVGVGRSETDRDPASEVPLVPPSTTPFPAPPPPPSSGGN